jgi:hypothetical protein
MCNATKNCHRIKTRDKVWKHNTFLSSMVNWRKSAKQGLYKTIPAPYSEKWTS